MRGHLQAGLTIVAMLSLFAIAIDASDNYTVNYGTNQSITAHTECRKVTNASATGASVYVPTQTDAEWQSFYTNPPAGVTTSGCVTPGSQTFSTAGTYSFVVPEHNTLTVQVWGAGGGGAGILGSASDVVGISGGTSVWDGSLVAHGGSRGTSSGGSGGTASGGTTNTAGVSGEGTSGDRWGGAGGAGANGGAGGARKSIAGSGNAGTAPGGGGSGCGGGGRGWENWGAGAGGGGYSVRTYNSGTYQAGTTISLTVGAGGGGGGVTANNQCKGGNGAGGRVIVTWN